MKYINVCYQSIDGEMGRWGDGEMGRWGDGEIRIFAQFFVFHITKSSKSKIAELFNCYKPLKYLGS
ncbi:MAG: hypothetical protein SWX82_04525 [Cyanobacteriota bacterium]|nr:hypothetical protein [Cyanobacteriota bacterium]